MRKIAIILIVLGILGSALAFYSTSILTVRLTDESHFRSGNGTTATVLGQILEDRITLIYSDIFGKEIPHVEKPELTPEQDSLFVQRVIQSVEEVLAYSTIQRFFDPDYFFSDAIIADVRSGNVDRLTTFAIEVIVDDSVVFERGKVVETELSGLIFKGGRYEVKRGFKVKIYSSLRFEQVVWTGAKRMRYLFLIATALIVAGVILLGVSDKPQRQQEV